MLRKILNVFRRKYIYKSSVTGEIVSKTYALSNPTTTFKMRIK